MWQFLISGYVPGTDFQVTFDTIAGVACLFVLLVALYTEMRRIGPMQKQILRTSKAVNDFRRTASH